MFPTLLHQLLNDSSGPPVHLYPGPNMEDDVVQRADLLRGAAGWLDYLGQERVGPGRPVLIALETCRAFIEVILAAWCLGAPIVPVCPIPKRGRVREILQTLPGCLLVDRPLEKLGDCSSLREVAATADQIALIQFSSGTTGCPKGSLISHANLRRNIEDISAAAQVDSTDVFATWLPLFHDMGLIGGLLLPLQLGLRLHLMPSTRFSDDPRLWIRLMQKSQATLTVAPPSAYQVAARFAKEPLPLPHLRYAWVGAEPIFPKPIQDFEDRFVTAAGNANVVRPCYGLAEGTLAVTMTPPEAPVKLLAVDGSAWRRGQVVAANDGLSVVSSGVPLQNTQVRISGATESSPHCLGEILVKSPSVSRGYSDGSSAQRNDWLYTGDLGFMHEGHLFVVGRSKDLIKRSGLSLFPEEIEQACAVVEGVRSPHVVAFSCVDYASQAELFVIVAESRLNQPDPVAELRKKIHQACVDSVGLGPDRIEVVEPGTIPYTTSGKRQRALCRDWFQARYQSYA